MSDTDVMGPKACDDGFWFFVERCNTWSEHGLGHVNFANSMGTLPMSNILDLFVWCFSYFWPMVKLPQNHHRRVAFFFQEMWLVKRDVAA